ncbi:hypothetical protein EDB84DRAFT_1541807 [Lactarius hengduanensis]|nr:hypothetical protein EDB84DRAFT_1541807 [Lactarius hengduanensis]
MPSFFKVSRANLSAATHPLNPPPATKPPGVSRAIRHLSAGHPVQGAAPQAPPMRVNLHSPVAPNQPSGPAGGFVHPSISPSPVSAPRPGNISHPGGFAPQVQPPNVQQSESYSWFVAIDQDGSGEISPEELRLKFSLATVKYLMSIFDLDNSRGIGFQEFESLWKFIHQWRQMFVSFDVDHDGKIDADELGRALAHYDFRVGLPVLDILVRKYAIAPPPSRGPHYGPPARPQIDLDHFVCACIVVRQMCQLYDQCSGYGQAPISRDDFIRAVITLP